MAGLKTATLAVAALATTLGMVVPVAPAAAQERREWYEITRCVGLEGAPWIACQKALKGKKRGVAVREEWYEKTRCAGIKGAQWTACQLALKDRKRLREGGNPRDKEWFEKTRCMGLEGLPWIECQKALKQKQRGR